MNESLLQTPYDIVDVPYIPWSPPGTTWLFLAALFFLTLFIIYYTHKKSLAHSADGVLSLLLKEIELNVGSNTPEKIQRQAHLVRRVVEHLSQVELSSLSPEELLHVADGVSQQELARVLKHLAELEGATYAPPVEGNPTMIDTSEVLRDLKAYVLSVRQR